MTAPLVLCEVDMALPFLRRWRLWVALTLFVVAVGVATHPAVYWPVRGWLSGEAWYVGWPTSYWEWQATSYEQYGMPQSCAAVNDPGVIAWSAAPRRGLIEEFCVQYLGIGMGPPLPATSILDGDPAALPVLLEMSQSKTLTVRAVAAFGLYQQHHYPDTPLAAVDALVRLAGDPDRKLRYNARRYLDLIVPGGTKVAFPSLPYSDE
jgi:hypothetical protein